VTLWLILGGTSGIIDKRLNLDRQPSPSLMADGIGGVCRRGWQYWLEDDGREREERDMNKPPYRVPLMSEIDDFPWNGYNVVSTFTGAGGACLGYKIAGFKALWASEFIPSAAEVYRLNFPGVHLDTRDIRQVQPQEILDTIGLKRGEVDVMEGSPPCASFSTAGKREAGWGKVVKYSETKQRVDDLFFEFIRLVEGVQPKVFYR